MISTTTNAVNNIFIIDHVNIIKTDRVSDWLSDEYLEEIRREVKKKERKEKIDRLLKEENKKSKDEG